MRRDHTGQFDPENQYFYIENINDNPSSVYKCSLIRKTTSAPSVTLYVSTDTINWTAYSMGSSTELSLHTFKYANERLYIKSNVSRYATSTTDYNYWRMEGEFNIGGNFLSLFYGDDFKAYSTFPTPAYAAIRMFCGDVDTTNADKLKSAENLVIPVTTMGTYSIADFFAARKGLVKGPKKLPATTLGERCYQYMFKNCTALTQAPILPATTLANYCYNYMFIGCSALTQAPTLPATTLANYCYQYMFQNCTGLKQAPTLPATTLATYCYKSMFQGCTNIITAPALPATTLATYCYNSMFMGCSNLDLNDGYELPASTLANNCYQYMFKNCTALTYAPYLRAQTLVSNCYTQMFYGCVELRQIYATFTTTPSTTYTSGWVTNVNTYPPHLGGDTPGTFYKNKAATWDVSGNNGIPTKWNVVLVSK